MSKAQTGEVRPLSGNLSASERQDHSRHWNGRGGPFTGANSRLCDANATRRHGSRWLKTLLLGALSVTAVAVPADAQQQPAQNAPETVVVTGTLLQRPDLTTPSPVTIITRQDIINSGLTTTSDIVRSLTADNSGTIPTAFGAGFAAGSSGVALRGLTVNSTLVLINGHRTANYPLADDGERGFVDLNTIPQFAIEQIQTLKDGASSEYGADAIAGVVNIILYDHFEGAIGEAEGGTSQEGGGGMYRFAGRVGFGNLETDHVNAFLSFEYQHDDYIHVGQRGFPYNTNDLSSIGGFDFNSTSSIYGSVAPTLLTDPTDPTTGTAALGPQQILAPGGCGKLGKDIDGNYCEQNTTLYGDDQPRQERYGMYGRMSMSLGTTEAYLDASYFENQVWVNGGPPSIRTTAPHLTSNIALPAYLTNGDRNPNNPFVNSNDACPTTGIEGVNNSAACPDALIHYLFGDITGLSHYDNHVLRGSGDVKGDWSGWNWDLNLVAAHAWLGSELDGFLNFDQLKTDVLDGSYNFLDPSQNSASVLAALSPPLTKTSTTDLDSFNFVVTHDLFELPGGMSQLALGVEARHEATDDPDLNPGLNALGLGIAHTIGNRNVYSSFGEVDLFPLKSLEADISGRFDHYSDFGNTFNPKFGLKWKPIDQVMLRGTYSTGFRAPSFSENGSAAAEGFVTENPQTDFPDWAALHNNDEYTLSYALGLESTSNKGIKPETSTNYTVGTVVTPFADYNVNFTFDYYHIEKKKVISPSDSSAALNAAFNGEPIPPGFTVIFDQPDPLFPGAPPRPVVVGSPYINAASLKTDGVDIQLDAGFDLTADLNWQTIIQYSHIFSFDFVPFSGAPTQHWVGTQTPYILSSGAGTPQDRGNWANTITWHDLSVTGTLYYTSGIKEATVDLTGDNNCDLYLSTDKFCHVKAFWDFDLTGRYHVTDSVDLYGSVKNLFNAKAPLDVIDYAGVNYNPTYGQEGIVGRFFSIGVDVKTDKL
jgi:iron complex outermembrane receptor protein